MAKSVYFWERTRLKKNDAACPKQVVSLPPLMMTRSRDRRNRARVPAELNKRPAIMHRRKGVTKE